METRYSKEQIAAMEQEFMRLQRLELSLKEPNSALAQVIGAAATNPATYTRIAELERMLSEVERVIQKIAATGQVRGRVMAHKTMERFLEKGERAARTRRTLDAIIRANTTRAQRRMSLYVDEMLREGAILKADIDLFRKRAALAGVSAQETNRRLLRAAADKAGPVYGFQKRMQTLETAVLRREAQAAELEEYRKVAKPNEQWQWVTVSSNVCPDCQIRAGVILPLERWRAKGTPGMGGTICGANCMCRLYPVSVSEDMFEDVKQFKWDKKSGVLTTASDMRTFGAKANNPK